MADGTQLAMTEDGQLAVIKRAPSGRAGDRLAREADVVRRATHPGVIEVLAVDHLDDGIAVHYAFVGGGTLAEQVATMTPARATRVAASVATTLADLHERGVAHGRLTPDHVLVSDDQTRLCGWADAVMGPEGRPCPPTAAAADVEAMAMMVRTMVEASTAGATSDLQAVADRVLRADPAAQPSMATLARSLTTLTGGDAIPTPVGPARRILPARPRPGPGPPRRRLVALGATVAVVAIGGVTLLGRPAGKEMAAPPPLTLVPPAPLAPPTPETTATTMTTVPPAARRVWPPTTGPQCPPRPGGMTADIDGDGCPEAVEVDGGTVASGGRRWRVASAGDQVVLGDWDCDGLATPAVVRTATGGAWAFDRWADGARAQPLGSVDSPASARAVPGSGNECQDLEVSDRSGKVTRLTLAEPDAGGGRAGSPAGG